MLLYQTSTLEYVLAAIVLVGALLGLVAAGYWAEKGLSRLLGPSALPRPLLPSAHRPLRLEEAANRRRVLWWVIAGSVALVGAVKLVVEFT